MQPEDLLKHLETVDSVDTLDLVAVFNEDHQKIIGALKSIEAHGNLVTSEPASRKTWSLTAEGQQVLEHGSHEAAVFNAVPEGGISQAELMKVREKRNILSPFPIHPLPLPSPEFPQR